MPEPPPAIDLNLDAGEGFDDAPLFPFVSSVNVACGAHAGDDATMQRTVRAAHAAGLAIGAHPGFADRQGFGRAITTRDPAEISDLVASQTAHLATIAGRLGIPLSHVKPHGALYNLSAAEPGIARAVAAAVRRVNPGLVLVGLAHSHSLGAARDAGLPHAAEAFVDRAYLDDRSLAPRALPGARIDDPEQAALRALALARGAPIAALSGRPVRIAARSLCLHGDTPDALAIARRVHAALRAAGVEIRRLAPHP